MVYVGRMDLETFLRRRLAEPLPGPLAHKEMIPDVPDMRVRLQPPPHTARRSAVLVPLVARGHAFPDVLFTVRSSELRNHSGQISFPGGRIDANETVVEAALRETQEETGVPPDDVLVLGTLTQLYIPPSNSAVTPVLGIINNPRTFVPSEHEVSEIFTVPLLTFVGTRAIRHEQRDYFGKPVLWPSWAVHQHVPLWGATAMILSELVWLVREHLEHS